MQNRIAKPIVAAMIGLFVSSLAMAQGANTTNPTAGVQLLRDQLNRKDPSSGGPAPIHDLNGSWAGPLNADRPEMPTFTALGQKMANLNKPENKFGTANDNDPLKTCDPMGFPRNLTFETRGIAFVQAPDRMVMLYQYQRTWRDAWMDGRQLPKNVDAQGGPPSRWYGYSVAHWEGDNTFVVDTVGSDDRGWLNTQGLPHSVDARFQERYVRLDHNHMELTVTVDDPKYYTKSFVLGTSKFRFIPPPMEMDEQLCVPSEAITYMNIISLHAFGQDPKAK